MRNIIVLILLAMAPACGRTSVVIAGAELQNVGSTYMQTRIRVTPVLFEMGATGDRSLQAYVNKELTMAGMLCLNGGKGQTAYASHLGFTRERIVNGDTVSSASKRLYAKLGGGQRTSRTVAATTNRLDWCHTNGQICPTVTDNNGGIINTTITEACMVVSPSLVTCDMVSDLVLDHGSVLPGSRTVTSGDIPIVCDGSATVTGRLVDSSVDLGSGIISSLTSSPKELVNNGAFTITSTLTTPTSAPAGPHEGGTVFIIEVK